MEPRKTSRGRAIYECPECGYQMEITEAHLGQSLEQGANDLDEEEEEDEAEEGEG